MMKFQCREFTMLLVLEPEDRLTESSASEIKTICSVVAEISSVGGRSVRFDPRDMVSVITAHSF